MPPALKPSFTKTASFAGSNESYNEAVWEVAKAIKRLVGQDQPDGDTFRMNPYPSVSNDHVGQAVRFLQAAP